MKRPRYKIRFPATDPHLLTQDQSFFCLEEDGKSKQIRFHDYAELYKKPGLYEQLFYDRLKCVSPQKITELLKKEISEAGGAFTELRVLDVGAGNGMMGQELVKLGVARLVGVDILPEALTALERDRPGLYDAYHVLNLAELSPDMKEDLQSWHFDCMISVAALGFGDIPPQAFKEAFNLVETGGWIAFNIKETFLDNQDTSGFSLFIKNLIVTQHLDIHHLERYRHRVSIDGRALYYYAVIGRKNLDIPDDLLTTSA